MQGAKQAQTKSKPSKQHRKLSMQQVLILYVNRRENHLKSDKNTHKLHIFSLALKPFHSQPRLLEPVVFLLQPRCRAFGELKFALSSPRRVEEALESRNTNHQESNRGEEAQRSTAVKA